MNSIPPAPPALDPNAVSRLVAEAQRSVAAALWLSAGMLLGFALIVCVAAGWRRPALVFGALYAASLCFVPLGHAHVVGPCGVSIALLGLVWPGRGRSAAVPKAGDPDGSAH